jgi:Na+(H+)/acetate symporter ActP
MGLIVVGVLVLQFLLVGGYLAVTERRIIKRSDLVGSLLAVLILTMWIAILALNSVTFYAAD